MFFGTECSKLESVLAEVKQKLKCKFLS